MLPLDHGRLPAAPVALAILGAAVAGRHVLAETYAPAAAIFLVAAALFALAAHYAARAAFSLTRVACKGWQAARALAERVFFVREFRLIRIRKLRNLTLEDVWDLPSRFKLETVQREFAYDVNQRFFLIRAIVRMVWRPLLPLMALQTALQVVEVAKIMARARLLVCLGAPSSYPWYHVYGAVLCEFLVSVVCTQTERVNALVHGEIQRATNALSTELFCLLLMRNGQRRHRISKGYTHMVGSLVTGLMCFMPVVPRIVGFPAVFMALYSHVGRLAAIPVAAHIAVGISYRLCLRFLGTSDQWDADSRIPYDNRADEIYSGIRTIKLFGWERMHTDPNLLLQDVARNRLPWYASAVRALWHVLDAAMMMSDTASAYLMMSMHLGRHPPAASGQLSVGLITVYEHAQNMCMTAEYVSSSFSSLRETMRLMFDFERALRGEPLNTLPQHDGALPGDAPAVSMSGCSFILNQKAREPVLEDVSLDAKDGELVAVVGKTGSGKSSLLLAICGELEMTSGSGGVTGRIAYLEQQPWIMNDTLRANVLFGREYDQAFFEQVVHACALTDDLARWPDADLTVIGERGINISGGQRARLALARTLYSRADVYVLDDPLSAVDAHVKRHILDHVLLDTGMLAGKLRIVATNSNHILPYAHQVVALKDRRATVSMQTPQDYTPQSFEELTTSSSFFESSDSDAPQDGDAREPTPPPAMDSRKDLEVAKRSYWENAVYVFRLCGWPVLTAILLSSLVSPISNHIISTLQLAIGAGTNGMLSSGDILLYIRLQMMDRALWKIGALVNGVVGDYMVHDRVERRIKGQFVQSILCAPVSFFDGTTRQHLSSAYISGANAMSSKIPELFTHKFELALGNVLTIYRIVRNAPYLILVMPLVAWLRKKQFSMSDSASHELIGIRRESEIAHSRTSFIIADGERMVRLLGVGPHFARLHMQDEDNRARLTAPIDALTALRCSMRLINDCTSRVVITALLLVQARLSNGSVPPAALAAYQNLVVSFVRTISHVIDLPRDIYRLSNSIDIFRVYASIKPEAPYVVEGCRPQPSWPQAGRIEFRDFSLRYRADLPPALDGVSLAIKAGEKVGIVGRTGSGKSTLAKSLFRLVHGATSGSVLVDGQDISQMGIGDLRPRLGIIPQESTMFDGSYCKNLDPLREHTIEDMWAALIQSGIAAEMAPLRAAPGNDDADDEDNYDEDYEEAVAECNRRWAESGWAMRLLQLAFIKSPQKKPKKKRTVPLHGLHRTAQSNIRGFSSGQQQLFSLCRVLMRKRRVIVLDEATANVDLATDREMQRIIRSEFKDHTVLTIAHRLETIMDCDRIVVMDRGRIAEVGSPKNLIDAGGHFAELVKANDFGS